MNTSVFLLIVLLSVMMVVLIALTVYLLDRLRVLENSLKALSSLDFRSSGENQSSRHSAVQDPYFYGLTGQRLWRVLESNSDPDYNQVEIEEVRSRFIAVLSRALSIIKDTHPDQVPNTITEDSDGWGVYLRTLRGSITVWLPIELVSQIRNLTNLAMSSNERELLTESERVVEAIFQRINASTAPQGTRTTISQSLTI